MHNTWHVRKNYVFFIIQNDIALQIWKKDKMLLITLHFLSTFDILIHLIDNVLNVRHSIFDAELWSHDIYIYLQMKSRMKIYRYRFYFLFTLCFIDTSKNDGIPSLPKSPKAIEYIFWKTMYNVWMSDVHLEIWFATLYVI